MNHFICVTCGVQYAETEGPPARCPVCEDERQYVGLKGQQWTTLEDLRKDHRNVLRPEEEGLTSLVTAPKFAIGQRAFLVRGPGGNVLWDCLSLLDGPTLAAVRDLGGVAAVAVSHPHYYSSLVEWSRAFGGVPVYLHGADRRWVMRPDPAIVFWEGETYPLGGGLNLVRCGGHFEGGTVLHWAGGTGSRGVLLSGDVIQVVPDRRSVSFMYSYPNYIPLGAAAVRRIVQTVQPLAFERVYGAFPEMTVAEEGKAAVARSAERYIKAIQS